MPNLILTYNQKTYHRHVRLHNCFLQRRSLIRITTKRAPVSQQEAMLWFVCETYVTNVWPVTSVCSQNAVQHIMIWPALMMNKEMMKTMEQSVSYTHSSSEMSVSDLL